MTLNQFLRPSEQQNKVKEFVAAQEQENAAKVLKEMQQQFDDDGKIDPETLQQSIQFLQTSRTKSILTFNVRNFYLYFLFPQLRLKTFHLLWSGNPLEWASSCFEALGAVEVCH